jgi:DNA-binding GntR family transcriptional regulator
MNARPHLVEDSLAPTALYLQVAERLRNLIFSHQLAPGGWVDEQALALQYGISRTPLREALKVLATEGLVTLKPRRGCYVAEIDERDLDEIFPLLAVLEAHAVVEAIQRAGPADIARLDDIHAELEAAAEAGDINQFFEANQRFHVAVQNLSGNRRLGELIDDMRKVLKLTRHHSLLRDGRPEESLNEHRRIMAAIRAGDVEAAEREMHAHLLAGRAAIASVVAQLGQ